MLKSLSLRTRLFSLFLLVLIPSFLVLGYLEIKNAEALIKEEAIVKAKSDLNMGFKLIDATYPGDWKIEDGQLFKGETLMNNNFDIVDSIGKLTNGDTVTIFMNDTRITTNVMKDGQRAVGTQVSEAVAEVVLKKGETFIGEANVVGHLYQAAYMPIKNGNGDIIGIWYVGAPSERINQVTWDMTVKTFLTALAITVMAIVLIFLLVNPIVRRIQELSNTVQKVANGDLSVEQIKVETQDEIGRLSLSMNDMVYNLRLLIGRVMQSAQSVAAASQQISASTEEIASGSENQSHSAKTINQVFKNLSHSIDSVAKGAEHAATLSTQAKNGAEDGGVAVNASIKGMNQLSEQMALLQKDSNQIGEIIEVIDDIAEQTNLLALNAAIEAARAGDQGRGFAVVADEVRKLAERSGEATKQIALIIKGMQSNTAQSVNAVNEAVSLSQRTGDAFENIILKVIETANQVSIIAEASEQQSSQSTEVLLSIDTISAASEETAAAAEETASSSQSLAELAEELNHSVSQFKI